MTERDLPEDPQKQPAETVDALEKRAGAETNTPESDEVVKGEDVRTDDEDEQVGGEPGSSSEPPA